MACLNMTEEFTAVLLSINCILVLKIHQILLIGTKFVKEIFTGNG